MKNIHHFTTLFVDIGGVLLTNGWDHTSREKSVEKFNLDLEDFENRHDLNFDVFELGKMSMDTYLDRVVFYKNRPFTKDAYKDFMYAQSHAHETVINFFIELKKATGLKIGVISNEGRELNEYRVKKFKLKAFVDFFVSSSVVGLRKPDIEIFELALGLAQATPEACIFIDNTPLFANIADNLGIKGIWHEDLNSTIEKLKALGLTIDKT